MKRKIGLYLMLYTLWLDRIRIAKDWMDPYLKSIGLGWKEIKWFQHQYIWHYKDDKWKDRLDWIIMMRAN